VVSTILPLQSSMLMASQMKNGVQCLEWQLKTLMDLLKPNSMTMASSWRSQAAMCPTGSSWRLSSQNRMENHSRARYYIR
jgi:hypothetical protein